MLTKKQHQLLLFIRERLEQSGVSPSFDEMKDALDLRSKSGIHRLITALEERGFIRRLPHRARALEVLRMPEASAAGNAGNAAGNHPAALDRPAGRGFTPNVIPGNFVRMSRAPEKLATENPATEGPAPDSPHSPHRLSTPDQGHGPDRTSGRTPDQASGDDTIRLPMMGRIAAGTPIEALRDDTARIGIPASMIRGGDHYALEVAGDSMIEAGILDGDTVVIRRCDTAENGAVVVALVEEHEVTLKRLRRRGHAIALEPANPAYETRIFRPDQVRIQGCLVGLMRQY